MISKKLTLIYSAIFNLLVAISLLILFSLTTGKLKQIQAEQFIQTSRNSILFGDIRSFDADARALTKAQFIKISYKPGAKKNSPLSKAFSIFTSSFQKPVSFTKAAKSKNIGWVTFVYDRFNSLTSILIAFIFSLTISVPLGFSIRKRINDKHIGDIENRKNHAIANTTQFLAHDIRKPFSMISGLLSLINSEKNPDKILDIVTRFSPTINTAISSANGMIQDVMEVGSKSKLTLSSHSPRFLIKSFLEEQFDLDLQSQILISYDICQTTNVEVDFDKIRRVFLNIIGNSVQALKGKGRIWLSTEQKTYEQQDFVKFTIGNADTLIKPDDIKNLFDAFFTKGKKGGTGLGLAIAKKIIKSHNGKIWCTSSIREGTEFHFTLPACTNLNSRNHDSLPNSSQSFNKKDSRLSQTPPGSNFESETAISNLESEVRVAFEKLNYKFSILLVDDEQIYRASFAKIVNDLNLLAKNLTLQIEASGTSAMKFVESKSPNLVFMDVDLGDEVDGYDYLSRISNTSNRPYLVIHSNRSSFKDSDSAKKSGADLFLPKPMTKNRLLKTILDSLSRPTTASIHPVLNKEVLIVIVEDSPLYQEIWRLKLSENPAAKIRTFEKPEHLFLELNQNPNFLKFAMCIITDQYFDNESHYNGVTMAKKLRDLNCECPILLSSEVSYIGDENIDGIISGEIGKEAVNTDDLISIIESFDRS